MSIMDRIYEITDEIINRLPINAPNLFNEDGTMKADTEVINEGENDAEQTDEA